MSVNKALLPVLLGAALAGCTATPVDYTSDLELSERPGMFSGEKGAFMAGVSGFRTQAPKPPAPASAKPGDYEAFVRWKKERDVSEEQEFEDWREWREWKKRQGR
jgi:hypothetical protein